MFDAHSEWLETDGLGGYATGCASGLRTRRYHGLLVSADRAPDRHILVHGFDAYVVQGDAQWAISSQAYAPDVIAPDATPCLVDFQTTPWPTWSFRLSPDLSARQEILIPRGRCQAIVRWSIRDARGDSADTTLKMRPYISGRGHHELQRSDPAFALEVDFSDPWLRWQLGPARPAVFAAASGRFQESATWYRDFRYDEERSRGYPFLEDLISPGEFELEFESGEAVAAFSSEPFALRLEGDSVRSHVRAAVETESARRGSFASQLERSSEAYRVAWNGGESIIAGYPWFADWGRDSFIALRGLCLARGDLEGARNTLLRWCDFLSEGMLPNRFPDRGEPPEYNSVDAALWFVIVVDELLERARNQGAVSRGDSKRLEDACEEILRSYQRGTRHGIVCDRDGLLAAGEAGVQLTWMDARIGDHVVTPRIGKPVEIQALWIAALGVAARWNKEWASLAARGAKAFELRFWDPDREHLFDVVDDGHQAGVCDARLRPNQILALGGLRRSLVDPKRTRHALEIVEERLWTPMGLRSLAPDEPEYCGSYDGAPAKRDGAYHQGTVWPWLLGPFVEAWIALQPDAARGRRDARSRFVDPLLAHLSRAGLDHVSEIADGDPPHRPRGCPFQAWSTAELLRLVLEVTRP